MKLTRMNWLTLAVIAFFFVAAAWYYPSLPDPAPTHWNAHGEVDDWTAKPWGVWLMPLILLVVSVVLFFLPTISPRGFRLDSARRYYDLIVLLIAAFVAALGIAVFESTRGDVITITTVLPWLLGLLFIALGRYLPRFPRNFFIGIRTPWTLSSNEVWTQTHWLAGWLMMAAGVIMILGSTLGYPFWVGVSGIITAVLVPVLYSLLLYRKLHGFRPEE